MEEEKAETEFKKENCVICLKEFSAENPPTKVGERGLSTLIDFSERRNRTTLKQYLNKLQKEEVLVHKNCRRDFTDIKRSLPCSEIKSSNPKKLRSSMEPFLWKTCCFLCSKEAV